MKHKLLFNGKQYTVTIPKKVVEAVGLSKGSELEFELGNRRFIFKY